jgi:hypothetical protein
MKYVAAFFMLLGLTSFASAQLLIEDFNYTTGTALTANGWSAHSGAGTLPETVTATGLTYTGYASSGIGLASSLDSTGQDVNKTWTGYPNGTASGDLYYSLMVNLSTAKTAGDYFFHLYKSGTVFTARIFAKKAANGNISFGIAKSSTAANVAYSDSIYAIGTTHLLVVKYSMIAGTSNDTVALWINPDISGAEPAPTVLESSADRGTTDVDTIYGVAIRQGSGGNAPKGMVDGIRVGTTWSNSVGGVLEPVASISPKSMNFNKVNVGSTVTDTIRVINKGFGTLNITSITTSDAVFAVSPTSATIAASDSQKFAVAYTPTSAVSSSASIVFTSDASTSPDTVTVSGSGVQAGFSVVPASLSFGNVFRDSTKTDSVTVSNASTTAHLVIDSVRSTNPLFAITPTSADLDTSAGLKFAVTFAPTAKGAASGNIVFYHNAPSQRDTLTVAGNCILKEPIFSAAPSTVNFGGVLIGRWKTDSVTVTNTGYDSLIISNVASTDTTFSITPTTARLDTMKSQKFYITFKAYATTTKLASIVFTSNVSEGSDSVKVSGRGLTIVSIAEVRKDANGDLIPDHSVTGDTLAATGIITTPNLQSANSQTAYFIQDSSAGVEVFAYSLTPIDFAIGDSVIVVGTVAQYHGLVEFVPLTLDSINFGVLKHQSSVPRPKLLTIHQFVTAAESYEGQLVEVDTLYKATGTWPASGSNGSVYLMNGASTDTLQLFMSKSTNVVGWTEPAYPISVVGVVSQYSSGTTLDNGYELEPRDTTDIVVITIPPEGVSQQPGIPTVFSLDQNYPNPFNPSTTISYGLPLQSRVVLKVYSILGQEVATLVDGVQEAGNYRVVWGGQQNSRTAFASGVYFFRISAQPTNKAGGFVQVRKMLLLK